MDKFIVVLGTRYYIKFRDFSEDPKFEREITITDRKELSSIVINILKEVYGG